METKKIEITREDFMKYYDVQMGGVYNMWDERALKLTGLSKEKYLNIIKNYNFFILKIFDSTMLIINRIFIEYKTFRNNTYTSFVQ